jgi:hypothetical protein
MNEELEMKNHRKKAPESQFRKHPVLFCACLFAAIPSPSILPAMSAAKLLHLQRACRVEAAAAKTGQAPSNPVAVNRTNFIHLSSASSREKLSTRRLSLLARAGNLRRT